MLKPYVEAKPFIRTLEFLARFGVGTPGQLYRAAKCELIESGEIVARLREGKFVSQIEDYKIPEGRRKDFQTAVLYLTGKGAGEIRPLMQSENHFVQWGEPEGIKYDRIFHNLIVGETFLRFDAKHKIIDFKNEDYIKGLKYREEKVNNRFGGESDNDAINSMGDFRLTYETENEKKMTREFEIIVRYSRDQILKKPEFVTYVACSKQQAEMIELATGQKPLVISEVLSPLSAAEIIKERKRKSKKREAPEKVEADILSTLELSGGGATKECLQRIHSLPESTLRARLESLTKAGKIVKDKSALIMGTSRGANVSFYSLTGCKLDARRKSVLTIRSYAVLYLYQKDYRLLGQVKGYSNLFRVKTGGQVLKIMSDYFDDEHIRRVDMYNSYICGILRSAKEENAKFLLATNIRERADCYKNLLGEENVLDLSLLPQGKSYRYVYQIV